MSNNNNTHRFIPLIIALAMVVGVLLGSFFANQFSGRHLSIINNSSNKISDLLQLIDEQYVDTVNISDLVERSLPNILRELDPHSTYTSAADVEMEMQGLEGHFSGIGIQFYILRDTVNIIKVIPGGPSAGSNVKAGDCIVKVDGKSFVGKGIDDNKARKTLKGPKGSTVKLTIARRENGKMVQKDVVVTRGDVPVQSVTAAYMLNNTTGYIRISTFGNSTYGEFLSGLAKLSTSGMKSLVIDLRGNLGGYMETAIQMCNEFLPKNRLIVYTEGRRSPREDYKSDGRGAYQNIPIVVLVDEYSASASEIFAGAMQDNDRADIIGRRTFGKGLVQVPIDFRDHSMLRLTRARYYTPSGRCVQKPYQHGDPEDEYEKDIINRELSGELFSADSIKREGKTYKTIGGREVFGGGGIIPDHFIPLDTTGYTSYFKEASLRGLFYDYAHDYANRNRLTLAKQKSLSQYLLRVNLVDTFATFAEAQGLPKRYNLIRKSHNLLQSYMIRIILDDIMGEEAAITYYNQQDPMIQKALEVVQLKKRDK